VKRRNVNVSAAHATFDEPPSVVYLRLTANGPMDTETYAIISERKVRKKRRTVVRGKRYADEAFRLREDLVKNKCRWKGDYLFDLWSFTRNTNPVVAMFFSHPLHPITRGKRGLIFGMQTLFLMMVASACSQAEQCVTCGFGCKIDVERCPGTSEDVCCLASWLGLPYVIRTLGALRGPSF
jgi:hypothetical protein